MAQSLQREELCETTVHIIHSHSQLLSHLWTCCCHHQNLFPLQAFNVTLFLPNSSCSLRMRSTFFSCLFFFFFDYFLKLIWLLAKTCISHRVTCKEKTKKIADESQDTLLPGIPPQISSTLEQTLPAMESKSSDDSWLGISSCHCLSPHCSEELISLLKAINSFLNPTH